MTTSTTADAHASQRLLSVDVLRGIVMLLMAVDHVRLYTTGAAFDPLDVNRTTVFYFATRWLTHFCAPVFVFLAGAGAFLHGRAVGSRASLARFLVTRGLVLILLELTLIRFAWTFNADYAHYILFGVISTIGACLIILGGAVFLPLPVIAAVGIAIVAGHNLIDASLPSLLPAVRVSPWRWAWQLFYLSGTIPIGTTGLKISVLFALAPWIGVTLCGYAFGWVLVQSPDRRRRWCLALGLSAVALFVGLRTFNIYGNSRHWAPQAEWMRSAFSFLNTSKYPASFQFLLMTLGPAIAVLPLLNRLPSKIAHMLAVYGRVPLFYYVLHLFAAHACAIIVSYATIGSWVPWLTQNHPLAAGPPPEGWGVRLSLVWLMTVGVWIALYWPCARMAALKSTRRYRWLSVF